jgi:hypothetical protein
MGGIRHLTGETPQIIEQSPRLAPVFAALGQPA